LDLLFSVFLMSITAIKDNVPIPRYEIFEVVLTSVKTYANPFMDVTVIATFTAPSGRQLTAYGFYDGNDTWRIRIAPDEVGEWHYVTFASDAANTNLHSQSGLFHCAASQNKGFIRPDSVKKYYFSFSDGTPFFAMGDTCSVVSPTLSDANRRAYLQARAGKPFNFLRMFASLTLNAWTGEPWTEEIAKNPDYWPWGGTYKSPDYDRLNPRYFQRLEQILGEMKAQGIYAEVIIFNLYEIPFKQTDVWTAAREALWERYVISRLSADTAIFLWTVAQEYERYPDGEYRYDPADDDWARRMATFIHNADPHKHPVNVHPWGGMPGKDHPETAIEEGEVGKRFGKGSEMDVLTHQHNSYTTATKVSDPSPLGYLDGPGLGVEKSVWADRVYDKPVINNEYGYEWHKDFPNLGSMHGTDKCRRAAWRLFTSGAAGLAAGFAGTFMSIDLVEVQFSGAKYPIRFTITDMGHVAQLRYLYEFIIKKTSFQDMNPAQSLVNTPNLCLANIGKEYVVYAPDGGNISINLSGATKHFSVEWLNPRTGVYQGLATVAGGSERVLSAPDTKDWVLHLTAISGE
jgi:hypothetical protein